tara:strand:+ start:453 stop:812 length:360 start_codon:yes stop_codon:yes gene_type:complete
MLFRSQFEKRVALDIRMQGGKFEYEQHKISYRPQVRTYTPDFYIPETDIYIEAKGRFISSDRTKMLMVQQQHPELDIRFLFMNCHQKIYKGSKTSYGQWCGKHNFKWANKVVPLDWLKK